MWKVLAVSDENSAREEFVQGTWSKTLLNLKIMYFL